LNAQKNVKSRINLSVDHTWYVLDWLVSLTVNWAVVNLFAITAALFLTQRERNKQSS